MKKHRSKPAQKTSAKKPETPAQSSKAEMNRRHVLRHIRNAAIAIPVIGAGGYYSVQSIKAGIREADLGRIGNGRPAIVQIHDPTCQLCQTLQRQTRSVMKAYGADKFEYLVAHIRSDEGSALALKYNVRHVTLLLFDGKGKMVEIVRGPIHAASLKTVLAAHMKRYG